MVAAYDPLAEAFVPAAPSHGIARIEGVYSGMIARKGCSCRRSSMTIRLAPVKEPTEQGFPMNRAAR